MKNDVLGIKSEKLQDASLRSFDMDLHQILARHMPKETWDPVKDALPNESAAQDDAKAFTPSKNNLLDDTD
ncbi:MAG: hypothetical protein ACYCQL_03625 [Acidithiobacillus sp.]